MRYFVGVLLCGSLLACQGNVKSINDQTNGYQIQKVGIRNVKLTDNFWLPIIERVQTKTIDSAIKKCKDEGRLDNFLIAGGKMQGEVRGKMPFDDTDVYRIIEGASYSLISAPNESLSQTIDSLIQIISIGQEEDGYLTTWRTINPSKPPCSWVHVDKGVRWEGLSMSHELYNSGHLYEAAVAHYNATGKTSFLDIAVKNANLIVKVFGPNEDQIHLVPGHQIIETGLLKLYQTTFNEKYLELAKYFLDQRGHHENRESFGPYAQDHIPVTEQKEVVGHAVRAVYMYSAMTDIAAIQKDSAYAAAVHSLWDNMVGKKMYVTGGIGATHAGEAFGENYELPNLTAYNETCASIGDVYWNQRMFQLTGDVKYVDVIERTLYNGLISGISLTGTKFFYPNPLESDGDYKFNMGSCTRQEWFDCSCCPTNLIRFLPVVPNLLYATNQDTLYVNLYASNEACVSLPNNELTINAESQFPWDGNSKITISPKNEGRFTIKFRVPGWCRGEVLPSSLYEFTDSSITTISASVNGERMGKLENGYWTITKVWEANDEVKLKFPMEVRTVEANSLVDADIGLLSIERGPLVYAFEEADNLNISGVSISEDEKYTVKKEPNLLGGIQTISNGNFIAIPYYSWANRGVNKMKVWVPLK